MTVLWIDNDGNDHNYDHDDDDDDYDDDDGDDCDDDADDVALLAFHLDTRRFSAHDRC